MRVLLILLIMAIGTGCSNEPPQQVHTELTPFQKDLDFLMKYDSVVVLHSGNAQLIASAKYQGKVFTSTADGDESFGWIHYKGFEGALDPHMNAYGGENRLWLGPEGGKYSLFFRADAKMEFQNWKTPPAFDSEPWEIISKSDTMVKFRKEMKLVNYAGSTLNVEVSRKIAMVDQVGIERSLGLHLAGSVKSVGYRTENSVTNKGANAWSDKTGMPCIWMLDMFPPSDTTVIVIPFEGGEGAPANTGYFGEIPDDRIRYKDSVLYFKADGKSRGKLGIKPDRALPAAGSYDASRGVLTITLFDVDGAGKYLNQEWRTDKPPFSGDAVNAYNDGPLSGGGQLGPFYELESVSPALSLSPGVSFVHTHSVFHFMGDEASLDVIARKVLHTSIQRIKTVF